MTLADKLQFCVVAGKLLEDCVIQVVERVHRYRHNNQQGSAECHIQEVAVNDALMLRQWFREYICCFRLLGLLLRAIGHQFFHRRQAFSEHFNRL